MFNHPFGAVKKRTHTSTALSLTGNTIGFTCRAVTKVIDGIFRLFGGNKKAEAACPAGRGS
jgi:hypothetical protein